MADDQLVTQPTLVGALVIAISALAGAVLLLWRHGNRMQRKIDQERKDMVEERKAWAVEREALRADYEAQNVQILKGEQAESRKTEAEIRAEFAELMERLSAQAEKSADAISTVLQKILDRFLGPRNR